MLRKLSLVLVICLSFGLQSACKSLENSETQPVPNTRVATDSSNLNISSEQPSQVVRFAVQENEMNEYDNLIALFTSQFPHISVQMIPISNILLDEDSNGELASSPLLLLAQQADVFPSSYAYGTNWQSLTLDLESFIRDSPQFQQDDFYLQSLQDFDGSIRIVPISLDFSLIYYNKDLFDVANLAYPSPGWSWDEFRNAARTLTIREGDNVRQWGLANAFPAPFSFIGGQLEDGFIDYQNNPPIPRFEEEEIINATHRYTDLYLIDRVAPDFNMSDSHTVQNELIRSGNVAMWAAGFNNFAEYDQDLNIGVVPYPTVATNKNSTMVFVNGLSISAASQNPTAAWEWLAFLTQHPIDIGLPARQSVAEVSGFWQDKNPDLENVMRDAVTNSFVFRPDPVNTVFLEAVKAILNGEKTVDAALLDAQIEALALINRIEERTELAVTNENSVEDKVVTEIVFLSPNSNLEPVRVLARQFEQESDIRIQVRSGFASDSFLTFSEMSQNSDCFLSEPITNDENSLRTVLSLTPFIEADPAFDLSDFYPSLVEQFIYQGQLWGLPAEYDPMLIEYNRDLFDAANVSYPSVDWTLEEFLAMAIALTNGQGDQKQYGFVPDVGEFNVMYQMLAQHGAVLVHNEIDQPVVDFTNPSVEAAVNWYASLSKEHGVKPVFLLDITDAISTEDSFNYFEERTRLISNGLAAMWTRYGQNTGGQSFNDSNELTHVGVAPLPISSGISADNYLGNNVKGYYISAETTYRQECWAWINYLSQSIDATIGMPPRRSIVESEAYSQYAGEALALAQQASVKQLGNSKSPFTGVEWLGSSLLWLGRAVSQTIMGDGSAADTLSVAQQTFNEYYACVSEKDAFEDRLLQERCLVEADPALSEFFGSSEE